VLVHGSVVDARRTWRHQLALAERWSVVLPNRPGFAGSPPLPRGDFAAEAPLIAELLGDGAHLVGHSYGAVIALLAAAARPGAVRSLVVSEPGALRVAVGNPAVDEVVAHGEELYRRRASLSPDAFLRLFRTGVHSTHETPGALPEWLEHGARLVMEERPPWEADIPVERLASTPFPKLVLSGGHSPAFEAALRRVGRADRRPPRGRLGPRPHDPGHGRGLQRVPGGVPARVRAPPHRMSRTANPVRPASSPAPRIRPRMAAT